MRFHRFINENKGWQQSLEVYQQELPEIQQLLEEAGADVSISPEERAACNYHFREAFSQQKTAMQEVRKELDEQQKRLNVDCASNAVYDIDALCYQDIIRIRVKELQKTFVELKCNFMSFLSAAL